MKGFGIHIGNTSCCISYQKDGKLDVLANDAGDRTTPSVINFLDSEMAVGLAAKQRSARLPRSTMKHLKSLFNVSPDQSDVDSLGIPNVGVENGTLGFQIQMSEDKESFQSVDRGMQILFSKMFEIATHFVGKTETDYPCCITVPINWDCEARKRIKDCAEKAGFKVLQTISEPAAALLAYGLGADESHSNCTCLVYRCGGSTLDVSLVQIYNGLYSVKATVSKDEGGDQLSSVLAEFLADEFRQRYKLDPRESKRSFAKLLSAAEQSKHILSTMNASHVFIESLCEGVDFSSNVSRARYEMLAQSAIGKLCTAMEECLEQAGVAAESVDKLVVSGGSMSMPAFRQAVNDKLPKAELLCSISADEVLAVGASHQAAVVAELGLEEVLDNDVNVTCFSEKLTLEVGSSDFTIFSSYTPVPSVVQMTVPYPQNGVQKVAKVKRNSETIFEKSITELAGSENFTARFLLQRDGALVISLATETNGEVIREVLHLLKR